jgi:prefoldin subunit 5
MQREASSLRDMYSHASMNLKELQMSINQHQREANSLNTEADVLRSVIRSFQKVLS